tara:strand:+ start:794 stop:1009 length:216 start_codon:yes stop_codon:yes gene_type:complete
MSKQIGSCLTCKHIKFIDGQPSACAAFPGGIPLDIQFGKVNHNKPYKGDNGIVYEARVFKPKKSFDDPLLP